MTSSPEASARVRGLLADMSVREKVGQLIQYFYFPPEVSGAMGMSGTDDSTGGLSGLDHAVASGDAGALLFLTDPAQINRLQHLAVEHGPHHIPLLFGYDVIHGLRTILPVPIALAASWDADVIAQGQAVAAREARAVGIHWSFAPMVDIARDPRWGRIVEGAGEDPTLGGMVAAAQVRGLQGERLGAPGHVLAGPKHFAAYGAALGGRDYDQSDVSDTELWNTYLPPFRAAIQAGAGNIMSAYMDLNDVPATGNRWLLTDVLRDALGFDGFVVSDANAVRDLRTHHFAADTADAAVRALTAGLDMEMAGAEAAFTALTAAVDDGRINRERLDDSVRRVLAVKEALGLFEHPYIDEAVVDTVLGDPDHRDVARVAAERSAVLLRNEGGMLPLDAARSPRVAVIGPLADSRRSTLGPWAFDFDLDETVTVADGIRTLLGGRSQVAYTQGAARPQRTFPSFFEAMGHGGEPDPADFDAGTARQDAVAAAAAADVAVVVLGEPQDMIGENASRADLALPGDQDALLQAVLATGTPTVLVLMTGRPVELGVAAQRVPAILQAWYPGTQGGTAVARLLFGQASPSGRLPFTWPRSVGQVPIHHAVTRSHQPSRQGQRYGDEPSTPLYPFGHGLTYTSFTYGEVTLDADEVGVDGTVTATVTVTNTGSREGVETVQLYLHQRYGSASRPVRQLKAFRQVHVPAGARRTVSFTVDAGARRYWSSAVRDWVLEPSRYDVWIGPDADATQHAAFTTTGEAVVGRPRD